MNAAQMRVVKRARAVVLDAGVEKAPERNLVEAQRVVHCVTCAVRLAIVLGARQAGTRAVGASAVIGQAAR